MTDMWTTVATERRSLADDLAQLTGEQWRSPSWCDEWSVEEVVAHMCGTASTSPATFVTGVVKNRFSLERFLRQAVAENRGATPQDTLTRFTSLVDSRTAPPGPKTSWLGEVIVHAQDIRGALGLPAHRNLDAERQVADFYKGSNAIIGTKRRIDGLRLVATDTEWSHGAGDEVDGPMLSLVMAMTGRSAACNDLTGPGVDTLRARCS